MSFTLEIPLSAIPDYFRILFFCTLSIKPENINRLGEIVLLVRRPECPRIRYAEHEHLIDFLLINIQILVL
jgi:hypothetical protein